jgi:hypothetical protein
MLKKVGKDKYQVYRQTHGNTPHQGKGRNNKTFRDWWGVRSRGDSLRGQLTIGTISMPEELVGKKVELFVRIKK